MAQYVDGYKLNDSDFQLIDNSLRGFGVLIDYQNECSCSYYNSVIITYSDGTVITKDGRYSLSAGIIDLSPLQDSQKYKKVWVYIDSDDGIVKVDAGSGVTTKHLPFGGRKSSEISPPDFCGSFDCNFGDVVLAEVLLPPSGSSLETADITDRRFLIDEDVGYTMDEIKTNLTSTNEYQQGTFRDYLVPLLGTRKGTNEFITLSVKEVVRGDCVQEFLWSYGTWSGEYTLSDQTISACFASDSVLHTFTDFTTEINEGTIDDVNPFINNVIGDSFYIGLDERECYEIDLNFLISTPGTKKAGKSPTDATWYYWNELSSKWDILGVSDGTSIFSLETGSLKIIIPNIENNWKKNIVNGIEKYWLRCYLWKEYNTPPLLQSANITYIEPTNRYVPIYDKFYINNNRGFIYPYVPPDNYADSHGMFMLDKHNDFLWQVYGPSCASTLEVWHEVFGTYMESVPGTKPIFRPGKRKGTRITGIWLSGNEQRLADFGWCFNREEWISRSGEVADTRLYEDVHVEKNLVLCPPSTRWDSSKQGGYPGTASLYENDVSQGGNIIMNGTGQTVDGKDISKIISNVSDFAVYVSGSYSKTGGGIFGLGEVVVI